MKSGFDFAAYAARGLVCCRVTASFRGAYRVRGEAGELSAEVSGAFEYRAAGPADFPVTGDWVTARPVGAEEAIIEAVLPRASCFSRRVAGGREERQPIAANIDSVFLVCGLDGDLNLRRLERYLALAAESGARPVVVLNKADLCRDPGEARRMVAEVAGAAPIVETSTMTAGGLEGLRPFLAPGNTVALLGSSGVGKSSIVNALLGTARLRTAEVRAADSRGRHTTTHRELIEIEGGASLIDTPGMRELQLWADEHSVESVFEEIGALVAACRFGDCSHQGEPGCAVAEALLDGRLDPARWTSYRKLAGEARRHREMADPLAAAARKSWLKRVMKNQRRRYQARERPDAPA